MTRPRILLLAQTPPPLHGQAVMQQHLVRAPWTWCTLEHIRLGYSRGPHDVGRFSPRKLLHLVSVVARVWRARIAGPIDLLYYPPCGPHLVPFLRDILTLPLIRWTARRTLFHFHAGGFDRLATILGPPGRFLGRRAYGRPDAAVVLHESLVEEVRWIHPRRVHIAPNGVPHTDRPRRATGRGSVLYLGLLAQEKGTLDLLEACRILAAGGIPCELHLAGGTGSETFRQVLLSAIDAAGIGARVHLHGEVEGAAKECLFDAADLFCYPSRDTEAMPVAILEALAAGLPVVTVRSRTLPAIVGGGGVVVPPADPPALARAIGGVLGDAARRAALGEAARGVYLERHTLQHYLEGMERVFRETLAG